MISGALSSLFCKKKKDLGFLILEIKSVIELQCKKRLMGYYFFPGQGSSGWLPSSVEYSPCSSTVAAQTYEGPDYQIIYSQTKCQ